MDLPEIRALVALVSFENYRFVVSEGHGGMYLQAVFDEVCIASGKKTTQYTRKWLLSPNMTRSEIVQTCFKLVMTSVEHRAREGFKYKGKRIFGPHFNVEELWKLCADRMFDVRPA